MRIEQLVEKAREIGASDIHLVSGQKPRCRKDGVIIDFFDEVLNDEDCEMIARELAGESYEEIKEIGELDLARTIVGERVRINLFRQQGSVSAVLRLLSNTIPELESLNLPPIVGKFADYKKGIVLVTGETGSGKSTTLASILNKINKTYAKHIITLEDPIEYIYVPDKCTINQREIGKDTAGYAQGLKAVLREDPDVIMVGEMRDLETIETAIIAAETGHLVFATLHTNSAVDTVDRIVGVFPAEKQQQIRMQLSTTLQAVLAQQLLVKKGGSGRIAACEVMVITPALRNLIREGKTPQMFSSMLSAAAEGSVTMDNYLIQLVKAGMIDFKTAQEAANDREFLRKNIDRM